MKIFDLSNIDGLMPTETSIYSDSSISKPNDSATYVCGDSNDGISKHNCASFWASFKLCDKVISGAEFSQKSSLAFCFLF